jgi:2-polyprenyl-3-methyl-5-hydroxy-6-metoxy-1,4-benzoquinol methylase
MVAHTKDSSALAAWRSRVESHHAQSHSVMDPSARAADFWAGYASAFRADPRRADDEALDILLGLTEETSTVLDVGGGAGRFALPLSLKCASVSVVDPSETMLSQLRLAIDQEGINNLSMVRSEWVTADVEPRDLVLCSHVVYGVVDIAGFIRKLEDHANRMVALVSFVDAPQSHLSGLWETVHGEPRIDLPALPELTNVLWDLDIYPDIVMVATKRSRTFESPETALEELTRRLFIGDNPVKEERLRAALRHSLESTSDGFVVAGARPVRQGIIKWRTSTEDN